MFKSLLPPPKHAQRQRSIYQSEVLSSVSRLTQRGFEQATPKVRSQGKFLILRQRQGINRAFVFFPLERNNDP